MELARYLRHTLRILSSARAIEEENKALRASLRVNTSTLLFRAFPSIPPHPSIFPASPSHNPVVLQPSVIRSQSLLHQRLGFQDGAFLFGAFFFFFFFSFFQKTRFHLLSLFLRGEKKQKPKKNLTLEKKKRDVLAGRRCPNPLFRTQMWKFDFAGLVLTRFQLASPRRLPVMTTISWSVSTSCPHSAAGAPRLGEVLLFF